MCGPVKISPVQMVLAIFFHLVFEQDVVYSIHFQYTLDMDSYGENI